MLEDQGFDTDQTLNLRFQHTELLLTNLLEPDERRIYSQLVSLNTRNRALQPHPAFGFKVDGRWFCPMDEGRLAKISKQRNGEIHASLHAEAVDWVIDQDKIKQDKLTMRQGLQSYVCRARNLQELRDALPEAIIHHNPELNAMRRQMPEHYQIANEPRLMRTVNKAFPLLLAYSTAALLY